MTADCQSDVEAAYIVAPVWSHPSMISDSQGDVLVEPPASKGEPERPMSDSAEIVAAGFMQIAIQPGGTPLQLFQEEVVRRQITPFQEAPISDEEPLHKKLTKQLSNIKESYKPPTVAIHCAGLALAGCAGCVNVVCFLKLSVFTSHVTGTASRLGMQIDGKAEGDWYRSFLSLVAFVLGSTVCGMLIGKDTVRIGMAKYGLVLIGNCILLCLTVVFADTEIAAYLAIAACGLQNGMATSYSGAVIRTTHVTGIATDVGLLSGRMLRRVLRGGCRKANLDVIDLAHLEVDGKKLFLLSILFIAFILGSLVGSRLSRFMGIATLLLPAAITGVSGAAYTAYMVKTHHSFRAYRDSDIEDRYPPRTEKPFAFVVKQSAGAAKCGDPCSAVGRCTCGHFLIHGDSMFCHKCGKAVSEMDRAKIEATQQTCKCGSLFTIDAKFCRMCGTQRQASKNRGNEHLPGYEDGACNSKAATA